MHASRGQCMRRSLSPCATPPLPPPALRSSLPGLPRIAPGSGKSAGQTVDMFVQIGRDVLPKRIEYEPHTFPARKFGRWNEVRIAGNENDNVSVAFESKRSNIQPDSHINPLLPQGGREVFIGQIDDCASPVQKRLLRLGIQNPGPITVSCYFSRTDGHIRGPAQRREQLLAKASLFRSGIVNYRIAHRLMRFSVVWSRIVVESTIQ